MKQKLGDTELIHVSRSVVLKVNFASQGQRLEPFLVVKLGECYWHLVSRKARDAAKHPQQKIIQPKTPTVPRKL